MPVFSWPRFFHSFRNDLILQSRWLALTSSAALVLGYIIYFLAASDTSANRIELFYALYTIGLLLGGGLFTSQIYSDLHHPLERLYCLTLPVSRLERFLARYLLTGPLFFVFFLLLYFAFDLTARGMSLLFFDSMTVPFNYFSNGILLEIVTPAFFFLHALVYLGAIFFRNYALPRTLISLFGLCLLIILTWVISLKLIFWDIFPEFWSMDTSRNLQLVIDPGQWPRLVRLFLWTIIYCWILFLAYTCLKDHEV